MNTLTDEGLEITYEHYFSFDGFEDTAIKTEENKDFLHCLAPDAEQAENWLVTRRKRTKRRKYPNFVVAA